MAQNTNQKNTSSAVEKKDQAQDKTKEVARQDSDLITEHGQTVIEDVVVSKIAGIATREVTGVYDLGGGAARFVGAMRERIPGAEVNVQQGVSVEVGEYQAAVDVAVVAEYGVAIHELAEAIRRNVIMSVERMTGLEVTEVNVTVHDVHLEDEEDDEPEADVPARVQ